MISEEMARKMGIKFFREQGCPEIAEEMKKESICVDDVFSDTVESLGKDRTLELYNKLPEQLKIYLLMRLEGENDEQYLNDSLCDFYDEFERVIEAGRPEKMKRFPECIKEADKIVVKYLKGDKNK